MKDSTPSPETINDALCAVENLIVSQNKIIDNAADKLRKLACNSNTKLVNEGCRYRPCFLCMNAFLAYKIFNNPVYRFKPM